MARPTKFKGIYIDANGKRGFNGLLYSGNQFTMQKHSFYNNCVRDLDRINATTIGADLLKLIGQRHEGIGTSGSGDDRAVTIYFRPSTWSEGAGTGAASIDDKFRVSKTLGGGRRKFQFAGKGSKVSIQMHNDQGSAAIYTRLCGRNTPTWIVLAHELIHAWHTLSGTTHSEKFELAQGSVAREEMYTTGLGAYANTRISENAIRREAGLPERNYYTFVNDHTFICSQME